MSVSPASGAATEVMGVLSTTVVAAASSGFTVAVFPKSDVGVSSSAEDTTSSFADGLCH
jgi:hypothetical protein